MQHDKSLECDDCDCACHDWRSEIEEQMYAEHCEPLHPCPEDCPWCAVDNDPVALVKRSVFDRLFGGKR